MTASLDIIFVAKAMNYEINASKIPAMYKVAKTMNYSINAIKIPALYKYLSKPLSSSVILQLKRLPSFTNYIYRGFKSCENPMMVLDLRVVKLDNSINYSCK
jgi:hypothetical protein